MTARQLPAVVEPGSDEHLLLLSKAYCVSPPRTWMVRYARDCYRAGRVDGERARAAVPSVRRGVAARRNSRVDLAIEIVASVSTLAGMRLGSTTVLGASVYLVASAAWCAISWRKGLHGIWPLNVGSVAVMLFNLKDAIA